MPIYGSQVTVMLFLVVVGVALALVKSDGRSIVAPDQVDAAADAAALRDAMKGWGTDEDTLINILAARYYNDRLDIARVFEEQYDLTLWGDVHSETSGHFREALKALVLTEAQFLAEEMYSAMKGWGTNEDTLINVLMMTLDDYDTVQGIKSYYLDLYDDTLQERIEDETSGPLRLFLVEVLNRPDFRAGSVNTTVNTTTVQEDLLLLKEYLNTQDIPQLAALVSLLTSRSVPHIKALREAWFQDDDTTEELEERLSAVTDHHIHDALVSLISACRDPVYYLAYELYKSMEGYGTDERTLTRIVGTRADKDLLQIKQMYRNFDYKELKDDVHDDTSGDYRKTLLKLIN